MVIRTSKQKTLKQVPAIDKESKAEDKKLIALYRKENMKLHSLIEKKQIDYESKINKLNAQHSAEIDKLNTEILEATRPIFTTQFVYPDKK